MERSGQFGIVQFTRTLLRRRANVRTSRLFTIAFLASIAVTQLFVGSAEAQAPAAASTGGHKIAVVDIGLIFREHPAIKQRLSSVETSVKAADSEIMVKRKELQQVVESLKALNPGSPDYAAQEEKAAHLESELKLEANRKRKELAEAEAKIYFESYQQIAAAVQQIALHNQIDLVLRYNSEEMDLQNEDSVLRGLQKSVVYHKADLNLTPYVMQYLNRATATASPATGAPAGNRR